MGTQSMMGVLSDAHGNWPAFDRSISVLKQLGATKFVFLGDALGYLPDSGVLDSIEALGEQIACVRGNHEDMILKATTKPASESMYQHQKCRQALNDRQLSTINAWPVMLQLDVTAGKVLFVHGSPDDKTYGYVYPDTDLDVFQTECDYVFMGNTHRPFIRDCVGVTYINVGSCGLPRDHGALGSVALFDEVSGASRIVRFDIQEETRRCLSGIAAVHPDVVGLFARRPAHYEGELFVD